MCESNAFVLRGDGEEALLEEVAVIEPIEGGYKLVGLFGEETVVKGKLARIDFIKHKVLFEEDGG